MISLTCFLFSPPVQKTIITETTSISNGTKRTETSELQNPGLSKFFDWVGIGTLLLSAWIWRKELGITQLGPLSGEPPVSQQPGGTPSKSPEESEPPSSIDLSSISQEMTDTETKQRFEHIMRMFNKVHSVNASYVSRELGVSSKTAKTYLFFLTKTGQLRADGFPRHTIYTPAQSTENRILDTVKRELTKTHGILSERRYVRVKKMYEIDSLVECDDITFIVEAKILRSDNLMSRLDKWILKLLTVAKEFRIENVACILAVAYLGDKNAELIKKQADSFTFDSDGTPIQIMVFSKDNLEQR